MYAEIQPTSEAYKRRLRRDFAKFDNKNSGKGQREANKEDARALEIYAKRHLISGTSKSAFKFRARITLKNRKKPLQKGANGQ